MHIVSTLLFLTASLASAEVLRVGYCTDKCTPCTTTGDAQLFVCWAPSASAPCTQVPISISSKSVALPPPATDPAIVITSRYADSNVGSIALTGNTGEAFNKKRKFVCVGTPTTSTANGDNTFLTPIKDCKPQFYFSCMSASEYGFSGDFV
ncbi:hypothetical protein BDR26DRAFT_848937 [Obelidium mucronatum]|nr:hypothetical protein BDR26DRAFT_848937 [Obelidium mucronatum]